MSRRRGRRGRASRHLDHLDDLDILCDARCPCAPTQSCLSNMTDHDTQAHTILLIEDDPDVRTAVERVLGGAGFSVQSAADGQSGLQAALSRRPELVLVDVGLPDRGGVSVTRELREKGFRSPILMLTARGTVSDKVSGLDAGADD